MRRMLVAAIVALFGFATAALANGPVVRWNAIVGVSGQETDSPYMSIADLSPISTWIWVESGFATLNIATGRFVIAARHISWASNNPDTASPIGTVLGGAGFPRKGRFVCDARGAYGAPVVVETDPFYLDDSGSVLVLGTVSLPQLCIDHPDQIAFVIGGANARNYWAFGAGRVVLATD